MTVANSLLLDEAGRRALLRAHTRPYGFCSEAGGVVLAGPDREDHLTAINELIQRRIATIFQTGATK
jgi:hypothetical protein